MENVIFCSYTVVRNIYMFMNVPTQSRHIYVCVCVCINICKAHLFESERCLFLEKLENCFNSGGHTVGDLFLIFLSHFENFFFGFQTRFFEENYIKVYILKLVQELAADLY